MSERVIGLGDIRPEGRGRCGGKATSLGAMIAAGIRVPFGVCITTEVYDAFVDLTGIRGRLLLELGRKDLATMRWEEMWDASLRIMSMFLNQALPTMLREEILGELQRFHGPTAVRSSAIGEDEEGASFAGIHSSYVNVIGSEAMLDSIRKVWASLFSHRALLYRTEIGLDPAISTMAVVVQRMVLGDRSGVAFAKDPEGRDSMVVEAVWGLNEGLVSGSVEPDRWVLDRVDGRVRGHHPPSSRRAMLPTVDGTGIEDVERGPPLLETDLRELHSSAMILERLFGFPQDIEFTFDEDGLHLLQSRPITTVDDDERRMWYLSLERSFENLVKLRKRIEEIVPAMVEEGRRLSEVDLRSLDDNQLTEELGSRLSVLSGWKATYDRDLIPFAHGMRLFGEVYNDVMRPDDPHEFVSLLKGEDLIGKRRNRALLAVASKIGDDEAFKERLLEGDGQAISEVASLLSPELERTGGKLVDPVKLIPLLIEMASIDHSEDGRASETAFMESFPPERRDFAAKLLDLGRASYRLRDDDNILLGRIEAEVKRAGDEGLRRLGIVEERTPEDVLRLMTGETVPREVKDSRSGKGERARQLIGQPAVKGIATGRARVIEREKDLFDFKKGEVMVCDSLDPNMTFVAPLCSAIVERRGGMLIHGAIIAREYGIPCVTGVPEASALIRTGDTLTVDGYLGLVIVS
jgi:phosphohistidine swiveling domain-containing protein